MRLTSDERTDSFIIIKEAIDSNIDCINAADEPKLYQARGCSNSRQLCIQANYLCGREQGFIHKEKA